MTLRIGFDPTQCAGAHDMSNRLIRVLCYLSIKESILEEWFLMAKTAPILHLNINVAPNLKVVLNIR